jgi:hypothetical protein
MPVIKKIYEEKLNKDPNEIIEIIIELKTQSYLILKDDRRTKINRRDIDDYIDDFDKQRAEFNIIQALKNFEKIA